MILIPLPANTNAKPRSASSSGLKYLGGGASRAEGAAANPANRGDRT
jgi:hypothetical protein